MTAAATLLPNGKQQFVNQNGAPLNGGLVYFYIPNTLTLKTTWQDAAKTIPNTNPVVLDALGQAVIYGAGQYRQILKDSLLNVLWDQLTQDVNGLLLGADNTWTGNNTFTQDIVAPNIGTLAGEEIGPGLADDGAGNLVSTIILKLVTLTAGVYSALKADRGKCLYINGAAEYDLNPATLGAGWWGLIAAQNGIAKIVATSGVIYDHNGNASTKYINGSVNGLSKIALFCDGVNFYIYAGDAIDALGIAQGIRGVARGLLVKTTSNTVGNIASSGLIVRDIKANCVNTTGVNVNYNTGTSGAGGLDTGAIAASTWYNEYVIYNPATDTVAALLSLSTTTPTLPTGYTYWARVGAIRTDGSSNLLWKIQYGNTAQYVIGTNPTVLPQMITGVSGSTTVPTWTAVAVANFVPPTAVAIDVLLFTNLPSGNEAMVAPNASYGAFTSAANPPPMVCASSSGTQPLNILGNLALESTNIYYAADNAAAGLACFGWVDNN